MKIKITMDVNGASDESGAFTKTYKRDEEYEVMGWFAPIAQAFVDMGKAYFVQGQDLPTELKEEQKKPTVKRKKKSYKVAKDKE
tara:strand:- start:146 stop:397 length:252 start_codon:yes stop_codon:yes gene_type:complete